MAARSVVITRLITPIKRLLDLAVLQRTMQDDQFLRRHFLQQGRHGVHNFHDE